MNAHAGTTFVLSVLLVICGYLFSGAGLAQQGGCLALTGSVGYTIEGGVLVLRVGGVGNECPGTTGTLRTQLIAYEGASLPSGTSFGGSYVLGSYRLGELAQGGSYESFVRTVDYSPPPAGTYYLYMLLEEYGGSCSTSDDFCIVDYVRFDNQRTFDDPGGGSGPGGLAGTIVDLVSGSAGLWMIFALLTILALSLWRRRSEVVARGEL